MNARMSSARMAAAGLAVGMAVVLGSPATAAPATSAFTYQGRLANGGVPVDGTVDLEFRLFLLSVGGAQVGPTVTINNQVVSDGLFTSSLDFGFTPFDGQALWLQVTVDGVVLAPRQALTAAPMAIRSLRPWITSGSNIYYSLGSVGIGTSTPNANLDIEGTDVSLRLNSINASGSSLLTLQGEAPDGFGSNTLGTIRFADNSGVASGQISSADGFLANALNFWSGDTVEMVLGSTGNVGIGTTLPIARLQVDQGADAEPGSGGYIVIGSTAGANIAIDNNEIMARDNSEPATLFLNNDGGDVTILPNGGGQVGIGTPASGAATLSVFNSLFINGGASPRLDIGPNGFILMDTGADIIITEGGLEVNTTSAGQTFFNRVNPDGTLVGFSNDGASAGSIAVFGNTVVYGTFTGAHMAFTDEQIAPGSLVKLTGQLRRVHEGPNSEPTYGITLTSSANESAAMGSYVCPPDASDPNSAHMVACVGNGEMWVVDDGRGNLEVGDYLISSDVAGAAMQDDPARFAVGHIIARAAEPIDWTRVKATGHGPKRALVSVFYESFDRHGDAGTIADLQATITAQQQEIAELQSRLAAVESLSARLAALESAASENLATGKEQRR